MNSEVIDIMAREEIRHIKEEQYAQAAIVESTKLMAQNASNQIGDLERRMSLCDRKHEAAGQHRRKSDNEMSTISATLQASLEVNRQNQETNSKILQILQEHSSTVKRMRDSHTFQDKLKESLTYIAVFAAGLYAIKEIFRFFQP